MASEKAPAFQFYPKDFLADGNVAGMSLQELGAYIRLICLCWQEGTLPVERSRLANMVGVEPRFFAKLWVHIKPCFREIDGGRLVHPRLEKEREKQAEYRRRQSDKGKAGAAARWPNDGTGIAAAMAQAIPDDSSPISDLRTPIRTNTSAAATPRPRPVENPSENVRVITRLAHAIIDADPKANFADWKADIKAACSDTRIAYDSDVAGKALESALAQRARIA